MLTQWLIAWHTQVHSVWLGFRAVWKNEWHIHSYFTGTFMYLDQYYSCYLSFLIILNSLHTFKWQTKCQSDRHLQYLFSGDGGKPTRRQTARQQLKWDFLIVMQMRFDKVKWQIQMIGFSKFLRHSFVGCPLKPSLSQLEFLLVCWFNCIHSIKNSCIAFKIFPELKYKRITQG